MRNTESITDESQSLLDNNHSQEAITPVKHINNNPLFLTINQKKHIGSEALFPFTVMERIFLFILSFDLNEDTKIMHWLCSLREISKGWDSVVSESPYINAFKFYRRLGFSLRDLSAKLEGNKIEKNLGNAIYTTITKLPIVLRLDSENKMVLPSLPYFLRMNPEQLKKLFNSLTSINTIEDDHIKLKNDDSILQAKIEARKHASWLFIVSQSLELQYKVIHADWLSSSSLLSSCLCIKSFPEVAPSQFHRKCATAISDFISSIAKYRDEEAQQPEAQSHVGYGSIMH